MSADHAALPRAFTLSRLGYYLDLVLAPVAAFGLIEAECFTRPRAGIFVLVALGFILWTLAEYLIHRFVFHGPLRRLHDVHHRRPAAYIGVSSLGTAAAFSAAWSAFALGAGMPAANAMMSGILLGYLAYIIVHDRMHHADRTRFSRWMRSRFERHAGHHRGGQANFGVLTGIWDRVFRTYR